MKDEYERRHKETKIINSFLEKEEQDSNIYKDEIRKLNKKISVNQVNNLYTFSYFRKIKKI